MKFQNEMKTVKATKSGPVKSHTHNTICFIESLSRKGGNIFVRFGGIEPDNNEKKQQRSWIGNEQNLNNKKFE